MDTEAGRLERLCATLTALGPDPQNNIDLLTRACGPLFGADAAVYYRRRGEKLFAVSRWGLPEDFNPLAAGGEEPDRDGFDAVESRAVTAPDGVVLGRLCAFRSRPGAFAESERMFLRLLSDLVAREEGRLLEDRERRRLTEALRQSAKMEAIALLVGGVAHDFNNALTGIAGNADLLRGRPALPPEARDEADQIAQAARHAAGLTRQLLSFSRKQPVEPVVMDLNASVAGLHKLLRRTLGEAVVVETELEEPADCVRADPGQVDQIVMNLAINARDAMPDGGKLVIGTRGAVVSLDEGPASLRGRPGSYRVLRVRDQGTGMTPEVRARLFEPFFTTKEVGRGTGLGLATVAGIVESFGGAIEVDSEPGRGTEFRVYFPALPGAVPEPPAPLVLPAGAAKRGRVLLVEDERSVRSLLSKILGVAGYEVREAEDAAAALTAFAENPSYDLVISDIVMPGLNGYELGQRLRVRRPETRLLFISGYADEGTLASASSCPNAAVLMKPFTPTELVRQVRKLLPA